MSGCLYLQLAQWLSKQETDGHDDTLLTLSNNEHYLHKFSGHPIKSYLNFAWDLATVNWCPHKSWGPDLQFVRLLSK